jgi:hypothetical protein
MGFLDGLRRRRASAAPAAEGASAAGQPPLTELQRILYPLLLMYGTTSDEALIEQITPLFQRAQHEISAQGRMEMLMHLILLAEQREISVNVLMPFVFHDQDAGVISSATLHATALWPGSDDEPLAGVRELAGFARTLARDGDDLRAGSIFGGMVQLGDRRIIDCLGPCWRSLSPEGRKRLASHVRGSCYAAALEWMIDWMEECEGDEFGAVAGSFAAAPTASRWGKVIDVCRALPVWAVAPDEVIRIVGEMSFETFADSVRPRLLQLAADEAPPRIMHNVLLEWGIDHTCRVMDGVKISSHAAAPRAILPLAATTANAPTGLLDSWVPLVDADFASREGEILVSWSIFNPWGPTWSCIGLLPLESPDVHGLFYRMLNPFSQVSGLVGLVRSADTESTDLVGDLIVELFSRDDIVTSMGAEAPLIGSAVPHLVLLPSVREDLYASIKAAFSRAPTLQALDLDAATRKLRQHAGDPWSRASHELNEFTFDESAMDAGQGPEVERHLPGGALDDWWMTVTSDEHMIPEIVNLPAAWHGAIDHAPMLGQSAFTFWQFDDFLARYGCWHFRELAKAVTRRDGANP